MVFRRPTSSWLVLAWSLIASWLVPHQIPIRCTFRSYQTPIRSLSDPIRFNEAPSFQIPQCNLIQKGANLLPTSFLSDSHQKKFWFFNAISILNQHTARAAQPILNFRAKTVTFITGGLWCTGNVTFLPIRLLSDYYQILSDSMRHLPFSRFLNAI